MSKSTLKLIAFAIVFQAFIIACCEDPGTFKYNVVSVSTYCLEDTNSLKSKDTLFTKYDEFSLVFAAETFYDQQANNFLNAIQPKLMATSCPDPEYNGIVNHVVDAFITCNQSIFNTPANSRISEDFFDFVNYSDLTVYPSRKDLLDYMNTKYGIVESTKIKFTEPINNESVLTFSTYLILNNNDTLSSVSLNSVKIIK